ncbi:MAG: glycosyltransferase [Solirubrobacteraceae bacterium]
MIAFGTSITKPEIYAQCAEPGISRAVEPGSDVFAMPSVGSIFRSYNALLEHFAPRPDLEALVLVHQDAEIVDSDFCGIVRRALEDPDVGVVGCVGAVGVRSIAWWEASVTCASFINRYDEHGGGELPSFSWAWSDAPAYARMGDVETIDGFVMVLSPWVVRNIRFDEHLGSFHGYDLDLCLQVRQAGRRVKTADFRAIHHRQLDMVPDPEQWIDAHVKLADKWDGQMGIGTGAGSWRDRALRAEADTDAALLLAHMNTLESDARVDELDRGLTETRTSISWRLTAPLRQLPVRAPKRRRPELTPRRLSEGLKSPDTP